MPFRTQLLHVLEQHIQLRRRRIVDILFDQPGRQREHPEHGERAEHDEPVAVEVGEQTQHLLPLALQHGVVDGPVRGAEIDEQLLHLLLGQIARDQLFGASQHERSDAVAQPLEPPLAEWSALLVLGHLAPLDRLDVLLAEAALRREEPRRGQREQRPQVSQAVLERRAGDGDRDDRSQLGDRLVHLRRGVLHELRLVDDHARPVEPLVLLGIQPKQGVGGDDDVGPGGHRADLVGPT